LQIVTGGTQRLALLSADHLTLDAGGDILDNNGGDTLNLLGNSLRIVAGGIIGGPDLAYALDANSHALDLAVNTVTASSVQGIYLQQLASAGDLRLNDVETATGPIEIVMRRGNLLVHDGTDG